MATAPHGKQMIDGYEIDFDHEDATSEDGNINMLYVESEKKRIDSERTEKELTGTGMESVSLTPAEGTFPLLDGIEGTLPLLAGIKSTFPLPLPDDIEIKHGVSDQGYNVHYYGKKSPLKTYIGVKIVKGEPQTCQKDDHNSKVGDPGYKVVYEDEYVSWSPQDVFENAYKESGELSFGLAFEAAREGLKIRMPDWKKEWFVYFDDGTDAESIMAGFYLNTGHSLSRWFPNPMELLSEQWEIV